MVGMFLVSGVSHPCGDFNDFITRAGSSGRRFGRLIRVIAIFVALVLYAVDFTYARPSTAPPTAPEPRRIALVVGNSNYRNVATLVNPSNDARLVARSLKKLGFTLIGGREQNDLDKQSFDRVIERFGDQIRGADVALFYYAGHGVQVRGSNYLVPIDANPTRESDVDFQLVDSETVLHQMEDAKTRLNIIVLDACRNNPFGGRGLRAIGGGLAQMEAPEGTLISYATQPGNVASDGDKGDSPFTLALVHQIQEPGYDIFRVFNQVGLEVERETNKEQQPWVSNSPIDGDFYFAGPSVEPSPVVSGVPDADVVFWQSIQHSRNAADYQAYLNEFPNGSFAALARLRAAKYEPQTSSIGKASALPTASQSASVQATQATPMPASPSAATTQLASAEIPESSESIGAAINGNFIVVGDPLEKTDADILLKRFQRFGYHPSLIPSGTDENRYSLKFGPYSPARVSAARDDLLRQWHGLTFHLLVSSPAGRLMDPSGAQTALETVKRLGVHPVLISREVNGQTKYQVEIGPFVTQKEAIHAGEVLGQKYSDSLNCSWGNCDWQYTWIGSPPELLCSNASAFCKPDE